MNDVVRLPQADPSDMDELVTYAKRAQARVVLSIEPSRNKYWCRICYGPGQMHEAVGQSQISIQSAYHNALAEMELCGT